MMGPKDKPTSEFADDLVLAEVSSSKETVAHRLVVNTANVGKLGQVSGPVANRLASGKIRVDSRKGSNK